MTNRREFLQHATTVVAPLVAAPLVGGAPATTAALEPGVSKYHAVLIDDRHAVARQFGSVMARRGAPVHAVTDGDVTSLWLSSIGPAWRHGPVAIAGLTRPPVLFCLEQLAWSQGLRVIYHAEHVVTPQSARATWPIAIADIVASGRPPFFSRHTGPTSAGLAPTPTQHAQLLTSWIIAPV
jgi:hypothetical protein